MDPSLFGKVQEIDPTSILQRMDEFETNSAKLSAASDKEIKEMKKEQENVQQTIRE